MALDDVLPRYDVRSQHARGVAASPEAALAAALGIPVARDALVAALFRLRGLPRAGTMETFFRALGFAELERTPTRIVLGANGRPWSPRARLRPWGAPAAGEVQMAFELAAEPAGEGAGALLRTETRVAAADGGARRAFRRYWLVVGPFSAVIRQRWLAAAARVVER